jgi:hydroxymethylpyrimidine pyrophosphatase-like HAD family hydrolase
MSQVRRIQKMFEDGGATAKISHIHVNGWFGNYDKQSMCDVYCQRELKMNAADMQKHCAFIGDSPNDEPMFAFFENSMAVANINDFLNVIKDKPKYVATQKEGDGFCEITEKLLSL